MTCCAYIPGLSCLDVSYVLGWFMGKMAEGPVWLCYVLSMLFDLSLGFNLKGHLSAPLPLDPLAGYCTDAVLVSSLSLFLSFFSILFYFILFILFFVR